MSFEFSLAGDFSDVRSAIILGATAGLPASPAGITHTVTWATLSEPTVGFINRTGIRMRARATDQFGEIGVTAVISIDIANNSGPILDVVEPVARQDGLVAIGYTLTDAQAEPVSIVVRFILQSGASGTATPDISSEPTTGLTSSPSGVTHTFVWNSATVPSIGTSASRGRESRR